MDKSYREFLRTPSLSPLAFLIPPYLRSLSERIGLGQKYVSLPGLDSLNHFGQLIDALPRIVGVHVHVLGPVVPPLEPVDGAQVPHLQNWHNVVRYFCLLISLGQQMKNTNIRQQLLIETFKKWSHNHLKLAPDVQQRLNYHDICFSNRARLIVIEKRQIVRILTV